MAETHVKKNQCKTRTLTLKYLINYFFLCSLFDLAILVSVAPMGATTYLITPTSKASSARLPTRVAHYQKVNFFMFVLCNYTWIMLTSGG